MLSQLQKHDKHRFPIAAMDPAKTSGLDGCPVLRIPGFEKRSTQTSRYSGNGECRPRVDVAFRLHVLASAKRTNTARSKIPA
jgi:hypothetical protein